jgi:acetyl-CoA carboxylase biotin carboxyl carrier protein
MAEEVVAPMVGKITEVHVKVGDKVEEDDPIVTFEAMKMETPLGAPKNGTVKEVRVKPGDQVEADTVLAVID